VRATLFANAIPHRYTEADASGRSLHGDLLDEGGLSSAVTRT